MDRILVTHLQDHARGQTVAGLAGRTYYVHPKTGQLHATKGAQFAATPGVDPADVPEFRQFSRSFKIGGAAPQQPAAPAVPPPPAPPAPPSQPSGATPDPGAGSDGGALGRPTPEDTKQTWLAYAAKIGVDLDSNERRLPKADLIALISERAANREE
jgi:hypothetical protein